MIRTTAFFLLITLLSSSISRTTMGQTQDATLQKTVAIPDTEVHTLYSNTVKDTFELWIAHPQPGFMPRQTEPVRVLYVLDANLFFGTAVEMTRIMHKLYGELPPLLVVGIAYPTDNGFLQGKLRTRDFTPSVDAGAAEMAASLPQMPETPNVEPAMGGADAFLNFLQTKAKPFIQDKFDVQEAEDIIFGSSFGGLFVTHTLLSEPAAFSNYIAVSPALWWNKDEIFNQAISWADLPANLYFAAGSLEEPQNMPMLAAFKLISNTKSMADKLTANAPSSTKTYFEEIEGETHTSVVPVALTRGLRKILRPIKNEK